MESFRPDQDDVRARKAGVVPRRGAVSVDAGVNTSAKASTKESVATGGQKAVNLLLAVIVLLLGVWSWWQYSRVQQLFFQLDEAQNYIRQGTLSQARIEGQLSETGEELAVNGDVLKSRLARLDAEMSKLDAEIRKLWVLANERNRKDIEALFGTIKTLDLAVEKQQDAFSKSLASVNAELAGVHQQENEASVLAQQLRSELVALSSAQKDLAALEPEQKKLAQAAAQLTGEVAAVKERQRAFEGQQLLSREELMARLGVLEQKPQGGADAAALARLRAKVEKMDEVLNAVDAGRAQFTSRWVSIEQRLSTLENSSVR